MTEQIALPEKARRQCVVDAVVMLQSKSISQVDHAFPNDNLVQRARDGDREAFGELVRLHRAKALGLAYTLTQDTYLAEDIVQEALIRAFMHLGSLMDTNRFSPWLQRIVRNQAYMKMRRGGPNAKESPFSSLSRCADKSYCREDRGGGWSADWADIDYVLFHMTTYAAVATNERGDPVESLIRRETLQGFTDLMHCLTRRERNIFEAFFFRQLPPPEIAALFGTTTSNVYNSLSRSKVKVQRERIQVSLRQFVLTRSVLGLPTRNILATPPDF